MNVRGMASLVSRRINKEFDSNKAANANTASLKETELMKNCALSPLDDVGITCLKFKQTRTCVAQRVNARLISEHIQMQLQILADVNLPCAY